MSKKNSTSDYNWVLDNNLKMQPHPGPPKLEVNIKLKRQCFVRHHKGLYADKNNTHQLSKKRQH